MKCELIQPNLLDYSKGLLNRSESERMKAHIGRCEECAALLAEEASFDRTLARLPEEMPANDVWALIRVRTKPRRFRPLAALEIMVNTRMRRVVAATATMAAVIGAFFIVSWPTYQPPVQPTNAQMNVVAVSDEPLAQHTDAVFDVIERM